jgi:serine/threonine protein kinase
MCPNVSVRMRSSSYTECVRPEQSLPSVLFLTLASKHPALESLKKIKHEYSLWDELDSAWAVRPLALSQQHGQMTLVLEDPGGETLDRFLPGPLQMTRFLRLAVSMATALGVLHKRELIHKDVKPAARGRSKVRR